MPTIDKQHYNERGYVLVDDLISAAEQQAIFHDYAEIFGFQMRRLGLPQGDWHSIRGLSDNLVALFRADIDSYIAAVKLAQMSLSVARASCNQRVSDALDQLGLAHPAFSTKPVSHFMTNNLAVPGGYHKAPPHQDWRSIQGSLDSVVVWVALADVDENSYPLQVIPKSHKLGLLPTVPHISTPMVNDPRIKEEDFITVPIKARQGIIFSSFLVHRTSEQGDDRVRLATSYRFNNAAEKTYIDHKYPTPYKYSYQLELMFPDFPDPADVERLFASGD